MEDVAPLLQAGKVCHGGSQLPCAGEAQPLPMLVVHYTPCQLAHRHLAAPAGPDMQPQAGRALAAHVPSSLEHACELLNALEPAPAHDRAVEHPVWFGAGRRALLSPLQACTAGALAWHGRQLDELEQGLVLTR